MNQQEIETTAYLFWEQAGKPKGQDLLFWLCGELMHERYNTPSNWNYAHAYFQWWKRH